MMGLPSADERVPRRLCEGGRQRRGAGARARALLAAPGGAPHQLRPQTRRAISADRLLRAKGNDCPLQRQTRPGKPGKQDVPVEEQEWGQRWDRNDVTTWRDGHGDGLLTSGTHCGTPPAASPSNLFRFSLLPLLPLLTPPLRSDAMWYVRALPNVRKAFETAYGEPAVAAYDRPSVNLPTSSGNEASLRVAERSFEHGKLRR